MQKLKIVVILSIFSPCLLLGCGEQVPVSPKPADGSNPNVQGSPQERIQRIESDTTLPPEERARRIQVIKERNGIK